MVDYVRKVLNYYSYIGKIRRGGLIAMKVFKVHYNRCLSLLVTVALVLTSINMPNDVLNSEAKADEQGSNISYGLSNPVVCDGVSTWDCIYFGNYWQNDTNGDGKADQNDEKEPIKWRVLSVDGDDAFLIADQNLDAAKQDGGKWESSIMRQYLNSDFLDDAFSKAEQNFIQDTVVKVDSKNYYFSKALNTQQETIDKVYLLSIDEARNEKYGFKDEVGSSILRCASNTNYANDNLTYTYFGGDNNFATGKGYWLLRTVGHDSTKHLSCIAADGRILGVNHYWCFFNTYCAIRPVIHLNLSDTKSWFYAGSVSSEGVMLDKQIAKYAKKIPKLSADDAKQFLAFVYNDSKYEEVDLTNDKYYKLLTGDLSSYNDDVDQLLADIHALSMFIRSNIDSQLSQSDKNTKYLSDNLIEYFKSELNGMSEVDDQVFKEYEKTWTKRLENGLIDIMSTELAKHTGIVVTEDMYANIELGIGTYKDIANIGDKTTTYVKRLCAGVQGFFLPLEKEKLGRYSYFSSYLDNRGSYSSSDDIVFETIMDYNFLAAKENSYISSAIDMTTWITGKDSWSNHREELDQWAEYLYQLESFVKSLYKTEEKPVIPTATPTVSPTATPTVSPTVTPTVSSSATPTVSPTATPTVSPTATPTVSPTATPTVSPSVIPTEKPKVTPISVNRLERVVVGTVKNIRGRKVVVKWKNVVGISGYQIQYAANKKYKKAKKTVTHKKQYVIKKLRKKKTYYIRVRAYTVYNGKTVYGRWSKVKKVKIKK